ncbi:hypothetical protein LguiB_000616 [Lonicera macranthoides]
MNTKILCLRFFNTHVMVVSSDNLLTEFLKRQDTVFFSRLIFLAAEITSDGYLSAALGPMGDQTRKEAGGPRTEEEKHIDALFTILTYLYSFFFVSDYVGFLHRRLDLDGHEMIIRKAVESVRNYQDPLIEESAWQWKTRTKTEREDLLDVFARNPRIWDDLLTFNPERHRRDDGFEVALTNTELQILSFSIGRRGCSGVLLCSTITTMLLARLLQGFTWSTSPIEQCIDLAESRDSLFMAKSLLALKVKY